MRQVVPLFLAIALGGCTDNKGAVLARCNHDGIKQFGTPEQDSRTNDRLHYMRTCMREAGYEYVCEYGVFSERCYRATDWRSRLLDRR